MQFSVGDKVVHPQHGPGKIVGIECREPGDGAADYYVIDMPGQGLTLHVPVLRAGELGIRLAMSVSTLSQVMSTLRSDPSPLPDDPKARQQQVGANIRTGEALPLARMVRDLTWHKKRAHLTQRDSDLLKQGQTRLAGEMALVSGGSASESTKLIGSTMTAALATATG